MDAEDILELSVEDLKKLLDGMSLPGERLMTWPRDEKMEEMEGAQEQLEQGKQLEVEQDKKRELKQESSDPDADTSAPLPTPIFTPAMDAALATTEILEAILIQFDMPSLLRAQRVNQKFAAVIRESKPLQKKLWLIPDDTLQPDKDDEPNTIFFNPLLESHHHGTKALVQLCHESTFCTKPRSIGKIQRQDIKIYFKDFYEIKKTLDKLETTPGSWKDMILFQPNPFEKQPVMLGFKLAKKYTGQLASYDSRR